MGCGRGNIDVMSEEDAAKPSTSGIGDVMTTEEIQRRFVSEWVLLEDPETESTLEVRQGRLLFHSKDRDEVYRKALELRPKRSAFLYTGRIPEGTAIVL